MFIRNRKGFTLVEIMIVVAIIGLLVAIAIPNLLRARISANESAAKGSMRSMITALENFRADQNPPTYPVAGAGNTLTALSATVPPYIEPQLASGSKQGYTFAYYTAATIAINVGGVNVNVIPAFSLEGVPQDTANGTTGHTVFYANSSGIIYSRTNNAAPYNAGVAAAYSATPPAGFQPIGS